MESYKIETTWAYATEVEVDIQADDFCNPKTEVRIQANIKGFKLKNPVDSWDGILSLLFDSESLGGSKRRIEFPINSEALRSFSGNYASNSADNDGDGVEMNLIKQLRKRFLEDWEQWFLYDQETDSIRASDDMITKENQWDMESKAKHTVIVNQHIILDCVRDAVRKELDIDSIEQEANG